MFLCVISCGKKSEKKVEVVTEKSEFGIAKKHTPIKQLDNTFKEQVKDWEALKELTSFVEKFEKISPNEALDNALELRDLSKGLRDSIIPPLFNKAAFKARVHVFYNETLRLADIGLIKSATADDVNKQVSKTLEVFSSINSKINTLLLKNKFEDNLDIDVNIIGIDTTKIDIITRESIERRMLEQE